MVYGHPVEQVSHFCYLGSDVSYLKGHDIERKLQRFEYIGGTINRTLGNKTRKETRLKLYKTMVVPILTYGSETWVPSKLDRSKIQAAEMRFLRRVKGCTRLDRIRNDDVRNALNIYNLNHRIDDYKRKWREHIDRMDKCRLPQQIRSYKPTGKRNVGRPFSRWDQL